MILDHKSRGEAKILNDYLICRSIEKSIDLKIPFQIHTGFGDTPIDVRAANPLHLFEVITNEELGKAQFVLIHAGYPY
ncbi:MAG: amidohydrolase family protein, partial [Candidatus Aenigmarchaeota archaeon]|nr:amidohydrolase family protein [Candidatus Aenigmarchaeota archaeon]